MVGATAVDAADMNAIEVSSSAHLVQDLERTDEMPIVRELHPSATRESDVVIERIEGSTGGSEDGNSDVFVCRRSSPDLEEEAAAAAALQGVTLFVYGWDSVQPGPLSWAFPSLRSALDAVRTMRNAVEWSIVTGRDWASVEAARTQGAVLVEQNA